MAITLALTAVPFTFVAARFATTLPSKPLRIAFGIFIMAIAAQMAYRAFAREREGGPHTAIVGAIGGSLSGIFSVGGAMFAVPVMSTFFGLSQVAAQGMGLALVAPGTVVSIATFATAYDVDWITGIALAFDGVFSGRRAPISPSVFPSASFTCSLSPSCWQQRWACSYVRNRPCHPDD